MLGGWALSANKSATFECQLKYIELRKGAKYRIELNLTDEETKKESLAWLEFEITENVSREYFEATILERIPSTDGNSVHLMVEPFDFEPESKASDKMIVSCETLFKSAIPEYIDKGSMVRIFYDGRIEETYPANLPCVYEIRQTKNVEEAKDTCVELNLFTGTAQDTSFDDTESINSVWNNTVNSKNEIIEALKSVEYEKTDHILDESEILSVKFANSTVWYAVEYKTENAYAIHENTFYKINEPHRLIEALGSYVVVDNHKVINHEFSRSEAETVFENGSLIHPTVKFRAKRFFYNRSYTDPYLVIPQTDTSGIDGVVDGFSVSKNVADFLNIDVYNTYVFYDEITDMWLIEIYDEADYQKVLADAEKESGIDSVYVCYDRFYAVTTDGTGKVLYYFDYFSEN